MIQYDEDWLLPLLFRQEGSVYVRASLWAFPSAALSVALVFLGEHFPAQLEESGYGIFKNTVLWSALAAILFTLMSFRTGQAFARFWEGTGLLHQMKGEWFDTVSNSITFTIHTGNKDPSKKPAVEEFRHTLVRLMSLCHCSALEEISGLSGVLETIDVMGLSEEVLSHVKNCVEDLGFNKVEVLVHLIQSVITDAHDTGVIQIPAPILSRVYQTISRGYVNLLNTKNIADTKFPFPFVQIIAFLLIFYTVITPIVLTSLILHVVWAPAFTWIPVFASHALNIIAIELEDPFGGDDNDLPLAHFQSEMNRCLLMLMHPGTDTIAGCSDHCITDFTQLLDSVDLSGHPVKEAVCVSNEKGAALGTKPRRISSVHLFDPSFDPDDDPRSRSEGSVHSSSNEEDMFSERNHVTDQSRSSSPVQLGGPGTRQGPPRDPAVLDDADLQRLLLKSTEDFHNSLLSWKTKIEEQVQDMGQHFMSVGTLTHRGASATAPLVPG